jgi:hypothetical protein
MQKHQIFYDSPVESIVVLAKRLGTFEKKYELSSEDFFDKFTKGQLEDSIDFTEWSNDYQYFLSFKLELEKRLTNAA